MKKTLLVLGLLLCTAAYHSATAQTPEEKIKQLGLVIPEVSQPIANYVKWRQVGNLLYLAGTGPKVYGKVGADLTKEQGYAAATVSYTHLTLPTNREV